MAGLGNHIAEVLAKICKVGQRGLPSPQSILSASKDQKLNHGDSKGWLSLSKIRYQRGQIDQGRIMIGVQSIPGNTHFN